MDGRGRGHQHHFGEGEYERSEKTIQQLLAETGPPASAVGPCQLTPRAWRPPPTGPILGLPRPTWGTCGRSTLRRLAASTPIDAAPMPRPGGWRSTNGRSVATGRSASTLCSAVPTAGSTAPPVRQALRAAERTGRCDRAADSAARRRECRDGARRG